MANKFEQLILPLLVALSLTWTSGAFALLIDVTQPGDSILLVNGVNDGDFNAGPPPAAESVEHAIDDVGQKYLNFLDLGSGFIVTPTFGASTGGTIVTGLRFFTANDAVERDPASYLLEGATIFSGPWTTISSGALALPSNRNAAGANAIDLSDFHQEVLLCEHSSLPQLSCDVSHA